MNKWFAWILSAAMCLSLMGCADSASSTGGETENGADTAVEDAAEGVEDAADTAVEDAAEGVEDAAEGGADTAVDENQEVTEAYQAFAEELEQAGGEELSWVQISCGTGENLLVVTKASSVYFEGQTMEADIYQYADGAVRHITSVSSTGSAYPLAYTDEAVVFGGNHQAGKLVVSEGTGELSLLTNMNIEGRTPVLETYSVLDGEQTLVSSQELAAEEVDARDFYTNAFADEAAEIIVFS